MAGEFMLKKLKAQIDNVKNTVQVFSSLQRIKWEDQVKPFSYLYVKF